MDTKQCMIVDMERRGDKRMFITEQVASISENKNGLWTVFNVLDSQLEAACKKYADMGIKGFKDEPNPLI